jgi:hypothetical protein
VPSAALTAARGSLCHVTGRVRKHGASPALFLQIRASRKPAQPQTSPNSWRDGASETGGPQRSSPFLPRPGPAPASRWPFCLSELLALFAFLRFRGDPGRYHSPRFGRASPLAKCPPRATKKPRWLNQRGGKVIIGRKSTLPVAVPQQAAL